MAALLARLSRVSPGDAWYNFYSRLLRTKPMGKMAQGADDLTEVTEGSGAGLAKVLTTMDLVSLGVGSCVGTGMYVVAGLVAKATAGPGVILSFIIAAMASVLSGVCYAEFGVRVPKTTGSAYTYSYVTVGEFVAFFIGWNLILEYLIGTAAGASALSSMFDLAGQSQHQSLHDHTPGHATGTGYVPASKGEDTYPDLLALIITLLVTAVIALGVRNSVGFNNVLNVVNLVVWAFTVIAGLFFVSASNWEGGRFLPYGWSGVSVILTLMVPYDRIDGSAPLMEMFAAHGFLWGSTRWRRAPSPASASPCWAPCSQCPGSIYAMARDGLLFSLAAVMALLVSLRDLIEMMSIGTLLAYTLVSVCVLLLRYQPDDTEEEEGRTPTALPTTREGEGRGGGDDSAFHTGPAPLLKRLLGGHYYTLRARLGVPDGSARPTPATGRTVTRCTLLLFLLSFLLWTTVIFGVEQASGAAAASVSGLVATAIAGVMAELVLVILRQPESARRLPYMAPCLPFVPVAAILVNSYLMLKLSSLTWIRFTVWCLIGLLIYGCYGIWNSTLELNAREEQASASTYQRYDDHMDDTFSTGDEPEMERPYQGWSAPEERGHHYQQQQGSHQYDQDQDQDQDPNSGQYENGGPARGPVRLPVRTDGPVLPERREVQRAGKPRL
ncbi:hypothetical protein CRUP_028786 [Coryphaenoides rupestris]|nr:hypothetical protein CRUP_028786 [Coryphaenoides rupestris]